MNGVKVAWGCGTIALRSAEEYYMIMQVRREWEMEEPFLPLTGQYFWKLSMSRLYFRAVDSGIIERRDVLNRKEDILCDNFQFEMLFFY